MPRKFDLGAADLSGEAITQINQLEPPAVPGTVLMPFHGPTRRFKVDYVVVDADIPDLPMSMESLRAAGLIA